MSAPGTAVRLCGTVSGVVGGRPLGDALRGRQGRMLFAYLVLHRDRSVSRSELIDALWPDGAPAGAEGALSALLSRLRGGLGAGMVEGRGNLRLRLPEDADVDVETAIHAAQRAQRVLDSDEPLPAGAAAREALEILECSFLQEAEAPWVHAERRRLEGLRVEALECLAGASLRLGGVELADGERAARAVVELEPYRESGYLLLMETLGARGNVAEALRVYESCRVLLSEELGAVPGAALRALHGRFVADLASPSNKPDTSVETVPEPFPVPAVVAVAQRAAFVGRAEALERLEALWERARAGERQLAVVSGEPGIGKTRLAGELASRVWDDGATVLYGRCDEEPLVPYQPFVEALRHYVESCPAHRLARQVAAAGPELQLVLPSLRGRVPDLAEPARSDPDTDRYRLFEAIATLVAESATGAPVLLVLDDLHWADQPTLLALKHTVRTTVTSRLLVLTAYRDTDVDADHPLNRTLTELTRAERPQRHSLAGLTECEVASLVAERTGDQGPDFVHALHRQTQGNPFFIDEVLQRLAETGSQWPAAGALPRAPAAELPVTQGIIEALTPRLERLGPAAREVLLLASVAGQEFELETLEAASERDRDALITALDQAVRARLVIEQPDAVGRYGFAHALVRTTLYEVLTATRRARLHQRLARALEALHPTDPPVAELAHHSFQARALGEAEKAVAFGAQAGARAADGLAWEQALQHYERALEALALLRGDQHDARCDLLLALGDMQFNVGDYARAAESFGQAGEIAMALGSVERVARAALGYGGRWAYGYGTADETLERLLVAALDGLDSDDSPLRAQLIMRLAEVRLYGDRRATAEQLARAAVAMARRVGDRATLGEVLSRHHWVAWTPDNLDERIAVADEIVGLAEQVGNKVLAFEGESWRYMDLLEVGKHDAAAAALERCAALAGDLRQRYLFWILGVKRVGRAILEGQLDLAEQLAHEALAIGQHEGGVQNFGAQLFVIRREQGRLDELVDGVASLVERYPAVPGWRCVLAAIFAELGREAEARAQLEVLAPDAFAVIPRDPVWLAALSFLARTCNLLGDAATAATVYDLLSPYGDDRVVLVTPSLCLGLNGYYVGLLAHTLGRHDDAERHYRTALARHADFGAPPWEAHTRLAYARTLLARDAPGDREQAAELIGQALRTAHELGLRALAQGAESLEARGARPSGRAP